MLSSCNIAVYKFDYKVTPLFIPEVILYRLLYTDSYLLFEIFW